MFSFVSGIRKIAIAAAMIVAAAAQAAASEPILGIWRLPNGILIESAERNGEYCGTVISGEFKGRSIGCVKGNGTGRYTGQIIKVKDGKRYRGRAWVEGNVLSVSGCVMLILCKTERLTRQAHASAAN